MFFRGEGVVDERTVVNMWVGVNPGKQTMYYMCKTWLQKVHSGWDTGGVTFK